MDPNALREHLTQLHDELKDAKQVDAESAPLLTEIMQQRQARHRLRSLCPTDWSRSPCCSRPTIQLWPRVHAVSSICWVRWGSRPNVAGAGGSQSVQVIAASTRVATSCTVFMSVSEPFSNTARLPCPGTGTITPR
jgi:hypothetical protein